jgi:hypothetical protein
MNVTNCPREIDILMRAKFISFWDLYEASNKERMTVC